MQQPNVSLHIGYKQGIMHDSEITDEGLGISEPQLGENIRDRKWRQNHQG